MKKLILFDVDGTLLDSGKQAKEAFNQAFREIYQQVSIMEKVDINGSTDFLIARDTLELAGLPATDHAVNELNDLFVDYFKAAYDDGSSPIMLAGVKDCLELLATNNDVTLGLQTGNLEPNAYVKLRGLEIDHYFPFGGFSTDAALRKDLVAAAIRKGEEHAQVKFDQENIFAIGDTPKDILAANENGIQTISVATGKYSYQELEELNPGKVLNSLEEKDRFFSLLGL